MKLADHMQGLPPARDAMPPEQEGPQEPQKAPQKPQADGGQEAYERVVLAASDVLYSEETMPDVLNLLKSDDPAKAIADATVMLIGQLDEQSGGTIPEDVIIPAAAEIAELIAELGQAKGLFQVDEQVLGRAGQHLLIGMAELYGEPTDEEMQDILNSVGEEERQQMVQQQSQFSVV